MSINFENVTKAIKVCCDVAEEIYPEIKDHKTEIVWVDGVDYNKRKILGTINISEDKEVQIKLNPYQDFLDLLDTIQHELAHLVQYSNKTKMKHDKNFKRIYKKIKTKWRNKMLCKEEDRNERNGQ